MEIAKYVFFVDSKYRTSGTNDAPVFALSTPLQLTDPNHSFYARVTSVEAPFSFSTVGASYSSLNVQLSVQGSQSFTTTGTITIPQGNYTILTLLAALKTQLDQFLISSPLLVGNRPTFNFTYDSITGYATLGFKTVPSTIGFALTLYWRDNDLLAPFFGFVYEVNSVLSFNVGGVINSINVTSVANVNVSPYTSIHLRSDMLTQTYEQQECLVENYFTPSSILLRVPVNVPYNTWILYDNDAFAVKLKTQNIDAFDLYFSSLTYDNLSFDGINFRATLEITEVRDHRYDESIKQANRDARDAALRLRDLQVERAQLESDLSRRVKKMKTSVINNPDEYN